MSAVIFIWHVAFADANIPKEPISVTYEYFDGGKTTLRCGSLAVRAPTCYFDIHEKGHSKSYLIETNIEDYEINFRTPPVRYFFYGKLENNQFWLALEVGCVAKDYKLVKVGLNPTCTLKFELLGKKLVAREVSIDYLSEDRYEGAVRVLTK